MKVCIDCYRVNKDDAEKCIGCGGDNFQDIIPIEEEEFPIPFYNNADGYKEVDDD